MDMSVQIVKPKRRKWDGGKAMEGNRSLSNLPDVLIVKILSLLPMKNAIRTSVLSKRWEYLWISVSSLEFYPELYGVLAKRSLLVNIVERALTLRGNADIKKFHLAFHLLGDASRVSAWISAVVRRNVEDLTIELDNHNEPFALPRSLLTCATLKKLLLYLPCSFKVPSTICFSSLRKLTLLHVVFSDDYSTHQLFSGCPVLEDLSLDGCIWGSLKFVSICAPRLLKLSISVNTIDLEIYRSSDCCQIMVFGVNLKYFVYKGELQDDYCFYNSSINVADIYLESCGDIKRSRCTSYLLHKLLRGISSVKDLTIYYEEFEAALVCVPELLSQIPIFNNLTTLMVDQGRPDLGSKVLLRMLQNCPCIQELVLRWGAKVSSDDANGDGMLDPLPPCFETSLKEIEFYEFYGQEEELGALRILLEKAMVLEMIVIIYSEMFEGGEEKKLDLNKQISDFPKGSENCEFVYYN